jgi:hypothetical protein
MVRTLRTKSTKLLFFTITLGLGLLALPVVARAAADPPALSISNLGQDSIPIDAGQPAFLVLPTGECPTPFTLEAAAACPTATWPSLGGIWAPTEYVAGGDALSFTFTSPVSAVAVASTSNWAPGQFTPSNEPIRNYDVVGPTSATPTSEATTWHFTLPTLNLQAMNGFTFSVVAEDSAGYHDYPFSIRTPRVSGCRAYYNPADSLYACGESIPPGVRSPRRSRVPNVLGLKPRAARRRLGRHHLRTRFKASSNACAGLPPRGHIIEQRPRPHVVVSRGTVVRLRTSCSSRRRAASA